MSVNPVTQLDRSFQSVLAIANKIPNNKWNQQFHSDLSPIGWHIGHCVFIESYWLQNKLANNSRIGDDLKNLYLPWLSPKKERAGKLPASKELIKILADQHRNNLDLLNNYIQKGSAHELLENNYLPVFLTQHYYQHIETLHQIIQCMKLNDAQSDYFGHDYFEPSPLAPTEPKLPGELFSTTQTMIGASDKFFAYDNERSRHYENVKSFLIAGQAVTNAEYLGFMQAGGYINKNFWSNNGWKWLKNTNGESSPFHWRQDNNKNWYCLEHAVPESIKPDVSVYGLNYFEAEAFALYVGCRLATEVEWEHAATSNVGNNFETGQAWEWCRNFFYPYPDFIAHPYKNYSAPWFDDQHYSLRGGSIYTNAELKRPTFRNFYTPEKKHIFAGVRLARTA